MNRWPPKIGILANPRTEEPEKEGTGVLFGRIRGTSAGIYGTLVRLVWHIWSEPLQVIQSYKSAANCTAENASKMGQKRHFKSRNCRYTRKSLSEKRLKRGVKIDRQNGTKIIGKSTSKSAPEKKRAKRHSSKASIKETAIWRPKPPKPSKGARDDRKDRQARNRRPNDQPKKRQ